MDKVTPLTLIFSPNFGAVHWDTDSEKLIKHRDDNLAGRQIVFEPRIPNQPLRLTFKMGRHPDCWIKIGWEKDHETGQKREWRDNRGYPIMNYYPRITLTFQWMSAEQWAWVAESAWFVIPGGIFTNSDGIRKRSGRNLDLYLNGRLATSEGNPEPLFSHGQNRVCLTIVNRDIHQRFDAPYEGKIIILGFPLDKYTTGGWPASVWDGPNWPVPPVPDAPSPDATALKQQSDVEKAALDAKALQEVKGRSWADVVVIALHGPDSVEDRVWYRAWLFVLSVLAVIGIWLWKR